MKTNIFSVTVAAKEEGGYYWMSLPEHQNIQFTEVLSVLQKFDYYKVFLFIEEQDKWILIAEVE